MIPTAAFALGALLWQAARYFPVLALVALVALGAWLLKYRAHAQFWALVISFSIALARSFLFPAAAPPEGKVDVQGYFCAAPSSTSYGVVQDFCLTSPSYPSKVETVAEQAHDIGAQYDLKLRYWTSKRINPGGFSSTALRATVERARPQEVALRTGPRLWMERFRARLDGAIRQALSPDSAALVQALTTGNRGGISRELNEAYTRTGLVHILSISGAHFGLIGYLLFSLVHGLVIRLPHRALERVTRHVTPKEAAAALSLPFMVMYLGLSGADVPAVRSFIMITIVLFGHLLGRRGNWFNSLMLAASVLVLWSPMVVTDISFILSFSSVLMLGMAAQWVAGGLDKVQEQRRWSILEWARLSVIFTFAITLGIGPLVAYVFHGVSVSGVIANLVGTPLAGLFIVPMSLVGAIWFSLTGHFITAPVLEPLAQWLNYFVRGLAEYKYSWVAVPAFPSGVLVGIYGAIVLWVLTQGRRAVGACVLLTALVLGHWLWARPDARVTILDVGNASSALVELPDGRAMAVDTGRAGGELMRYLRYLGRRELDVLVLTHGHADHTGGLKRLFDEITVRELWDNGMVEYAPGALPEGLARRAVQRGFVANGEDYSIIVLHPYEGFTPSGSNDNLRVNETSLVFMLETGGLKFLFTGDAGPDAIRQLSALTPEQMRADVLQLPHHGRQEDVARWLMQATGASVVAVSAEEFALDTGSAQALVTGRDGAVIVEVQEGALHARGYAQGRLAPVASPMDEAHNYMALLGL